MTVAVFGGMVNIEAVVVQKDDGVFVDMCRSSECRSAWRKGQRKNSQMGIASNCNQNGLRCLHGVRLLARQTAMIVVVNSVLKSSNADKFR